MSARQSLAAIVQAGIDAGMPVYPHRRDVPNGWAVQYVGDTRRFVRGQYNKILDNPQRGGMCFVLTLPGRQVFLGRTREAAIKALQKRIEHKDFHSKPLDPAPAWPPARPVEVPSPRARRAAPTTPDTGEFTLWQRLTK